jgi:hypothetical protein
MPRRNRGTPRSEFPGCFEELDILPESSSLGITMYCFLRSGAARRLQALPAVFLCWASVWAGELAGNALTHEGWTIEADIDRARLTIKHARVGTVLQEVHLNVEAGGTLNELKQWKTDSGAPGRLVVRTLAPATTWSFEPTRNRLTISSTAPGAVLAAQAPVSPARRLARLLDPDGVPVTWQGTGEVAGSYGGSLTCNPSFLPRENPECMYFALGQVTGSVFHSLFDQGTDTAIRFPEQTHFSMRDTGKDWLEVKMPLPGPGMIRLVQDYYTKTLGVPYYVPFSNSPFARAPMVWCSWTSYYGDVTEDAIVENTDWLSEHLKPYGFQYVQIDDGYDRGPKEGHYWIEHWDKSKFPKGPEWIARYIKSKGLHPGLWLVPNAYGGAVETHPDWYLHDRQGNIVLDYGTPALDSSHPEVLDFLKKLFGTLGGCGFEYYKFDGEHALPKYAPPVDLKRLHDPMADPLAVYRHRLDVIRQVVGTNTFIEGCPAGTPLNGIGFFNSYFNGHDVYNNWHGMHALFSSINANAFLNRVVVYVMPGEGLELGERISVEEAERRRPAEVVETARTRENPMIGFGVTTAEARTLVSLVALTGVAYPLAGVMPELPSERLPLLQRTMPTMPIAPMDLFSRGTDVDWDTFKHIRADDYIHHYPEILDLKVEAKTGTYDVVALPNWRSSPTTKTVALGRQLGLPEGEQFVAFDFWNQKLLGVVSDRIKVEVEGHDTCVLLVHPYLKRPQLLGTSRHISGAFSVQSLSWDAAGKTLQGLSEIVPGEDYTLFLHHPSGASSDSKPSASVAGSSIPVRQVRTGNLLSVSFKSQQSPVAWQIRF